MLTGLPDELLERILESLCSLKKEHDAAPSSASLSLTCRCLRLFLRSRPPLLATLIRRDNGYLIEPALHASLCLHPGVQSAVLQDLLTRPSSRMLAPNQIKRVMLSCCDIHGQHDQSDGGDRSALQCMMSFVRGQNHWAAADMERMLSSCCSHCIRYDWVKPMSITMDALQEMQVDDDARIYSLSCMLITACQVGSTDSLTKLLRRVQQLAPWSTLRRTLCQAGCRALANGHEPALGAMIEVVGELEMRRSVQYSVMLLTRSMATAARQGSSHYDAAFRKMFHLCYIGSPDKNPRDQSDSDKAAGPADDALLSTQLRVCALHGNAALLSFLIEYCTRRCSASWLSSVSESALKDSCLSAHHACCRILLTRCAHESRMSALSSACNAGCTKSARHLIQHSMGPRCSLPERTDMLRHVHECVLSAAARGHSSVLRLLVATVQSALKDDPLTVLPETIGIELPSFVKSPQTFKTLLEYCSSLHIGAPPHISNHQTGFEAQVVESLHRCSTVPRHGHRVMRTIMHHHGASAIAVKTASAWVPAVFESACSHGNECILAYILDHPDLAAEVRQDRAHQALKYHMSRHSCNRQVAALLMKYLHPEMSRRSIKRALRAS